MQTHKNPTLRTGPAPFKPTQFGSITTPAKAVNNSVNSNGTSNSVTGSSLANAAASKEPVFTRDGKKWLIEHQRNNSGLMVDDAEMNNVVYVYRCENSTVTVKGKVNNIVMDSCRKCSLLFDSVVASIEFVNCQSVQMQVLGFVPTVIIDKTDGCQMYLSSNSLGVEVVSSKSSEMNVMLPQDNGDYVSPSYSCPPSYCHLALAPVSLYKSCITGCVCFQLELAMPEQFKTTISGKALKTVCVDSLG